MLRGAGPVVSDAVVLASADALFSSFLVHSLLIPPSGELQKFHLEK